MDTKTELKPSAKSESNRGPYLSFRRKVCWWTVLVLIVPVVILLFGNVNLYGGEGFKTVLILTAEVWGLGILAIVLSSILELVNNRYKSWRSQNEKKGIR